MVRKTHLAAGIFVSLPYIVLDPISAFGVLGAVAPDYDIKLKNLGIKHRTITHTIIALTGSGLIAGALSQSMAITWLFSYASHLALDSLTKQGVPLLYPFSKKSYGFKLFTTGEKVDHCLEYVFHFGSAWFLLNNFESIALNAVDKIQLLLK